MRPGEVVCLTHANVTTYGFKVRKTQTRYTDPKSGDYIIEIKDSPKSKKGIRFVPIPEAYLWLLDEISKINPTEDYVFLENGVQLTTQKLRRRQYKICKKLGITKKSPNKGRKTYASILLDNHVDNNTTQVVMGHEQIETTERNYHRNRKDEEKLFRIVSDLPEFKQA